MMDLDTEQAVADTLAEMRCADCGRPGSEQDEPCLAMTTTGTLGTWRTHHTFGLLRSRVSEIFGLIPLQRGP